MEQDDKVDLAVFNKGRRLHKAVCDMNIEKVRACLADGAPINFIHPGQGLSTLHYAASLGHIAIARELAAHPECNFLVRDSRGRLPSEVAENDEVYELLMKRALEQARDQGIKLGFRGEPTKPTMPR